MSNDMFFFLNLLLFFYNELKLCWVTLMRNLCGTLNKRFFVMHWLKTKGSQPNNNTFLGIKMLDWQNPRYHTGRRRSQLMKDNFIKLTDKLNRPFPSSRSRYLQHEAKFKTFLVKMSFIWMRIKIVFIPMASHLASSWNRGLRQLGNVLFAFERDSIADFLSVSLLTDDSLWWRAGTRTFSFEFLYEQKFFFINLVEQIDFFFTPAPADVLRFVVFFVFCLKKFT